MKIEKMHIHFDPEGDLLELRFGNITKSYFEDICDDIFERRDQKTGKITGFSIFNVKKRKTKILKDLKLDLSGISAF